MQYTSTSPEPVSNSMLLELKVVEEKEWGKGYRRVLVKKNVRGGASPEIWGGSLGLAPALLLFTK